MRRATKTTVAVVALAAFASMGLAVEAAGAAAAEPAGSAPGPRTGAATAPAAGPPDAIAQPNTCGWVTCTYYFGKRATRDLASTSIAGTCGVLGRVPGAGVVLVAACGVYATAIHVQANRARNRNKCLKIKYPRVQPPGPPVLVPDIYSNRRCR